jgi:hypothetical protein
MTLSDEELGALRNLAAKKAGGDVGWINISQARALTELGLARRNREGWEITDEGSAFLKDQPQPPAATPDLIPFARPIDR